MADPSPLRDSAASTGADPDDGSTAGTPRWVKVFGIIAFIVILFFVVSLLLGVRHGPGRHAVSGGASGHVSPLAVTEPGAEQP